MNGSVLFQDSGSRSNRNFSGDLFDLANSSNMRSNNITNRASFTTGAAFYNAESGRGAFSNIPAPPWNGQQIQPETTFNNQGPGLNSDSKSLLDFEDLARQASQGEATAETAATVSSGVAAGASTALSSISGPLGWAAIINQQLGSATNSILSGQDQKAIGGDYAQNIQQHGLNVQLNSEIIRNVQETGARTREAYGAAGSLLGPIGALLGHSVASIASVNPQLLQTASGFGGSVNPSQSGIVASQTTAASSNDSVLQNSL